MPPRKLHTYEIDEARLVFAGSLDMERIVVIEEASWPNWIAAIGARFHGSPPPSHNAITLGNRLYFPVMLSTAPAADPPTRLGHIAWLIHELTHSWQFQHVGTGYFFRALQAQLTLGQQAYAYGWQAGLEQALAQGKNFSEFNPEQQGEIARHYYYRLKKGLDLSAWKPWILAMQAK